MASFFDEVLTPDLHFPNAPECRTRTAAMTDYPDTRHFSQPAPPGDQGGVVLHAIYVPFTPDNIVRRQVVDLGRGKVRKSARCGESDLQAESEYLRELEKRTAVPVPHVEEYTCTDEFEQIVMTKLPGTPFMDVAPDFTDQELEAVADQLVVFIREWRKLQHPSIRAGMIGRDHRPSHVQSAEDLVYHRFQPYIDIPGVKDFLQQRTAILASETMIFTHGDLDPTNIMIKEKTICGVIDFEMSGYFPPFWEWLMVRRCLAIWPESRWHEFLAHRLEETLDSHVCEKALEIELLLNALYDFSHPPLEPEEREQSRPEAWKAVCSILGSDPATAPMPDINHNSQHLFWVERVADVKSEE